MCSAWQIVEPDKLPECLVKDVMTRDVCTIGADETLRAAAVRMKNLGVGALAVCESGQPTGIVTDRDIVVRAIAAGCDPEHDEVRVAMTPQIVSCSQDDDIERAVAVMRDRSVRRLLVTDGAEQLLGVLSVDDVALANPDLAGEVIEHSLVPGRPPHQRQWPWWE